MASLRFTDLVFGDVPVMVPHASGKFNILNPAWQEFIKEQCSVEMQRLTYVLTPVGRDVLREVNARRQPLVYVGFRFIKDPNLVFHQAVINTDRTLMELRTTDGSTPLIGWAWENRGLRVYGHPMVEKMVNITRRFSSWWTVENLRGETANEFLGLRISQ